ncbi:uncharacterized protein LOC129371176 [Poeciliopsis prolifica]|uniref:uncharacterized protein LOC129371176 n=1 Tax=Poeciliopsis prolifica TaxID=188132 RepID=UPI0024132762|nr:uncharacterized protein LOC129371176 [Poeciliopsis prolifica]
MENDQTVPKRSLRLSINGYYDFNGEPTISYRETRVRFMIGRRKKRPLNRLIGESEEEDDMKEEMATLMQRPGIIVVILLFFGCTCLLSALHLRYSESLVPLSLLDMDKCQEKLPESYHQDLLEMKKKFEYLLPQADLWPNFALESQGARVVYTNTTETYQSFRSCKLFGIPLNQQPLGPNIVIQGRTHLNPGESWAFAGFPGSLSVELSHKAIVTRVCGSHSEDDIPIFHSFQRSKGIFCLWKEEYKRKGDFLGKLSI